MRFATVSPMQLSPNPSVSLLSIAGRAGHAFDVQTMIAGFACHAKGVELAETTDDRARAIVKSKRAHTVDLRAQSGRLVVHCDCPAESMGLRACKHTWAALLEVDRQGGLASLRKKRGQVDLLADPEKASLAQVPAEAEAAEPRKRGRPTKVAAASPPAAKVTAPPAAADRAPGKKRGRRAKVAVAAAPAPAKIAVAAAPAPAKKGRPAKVAAATAVPETAPRKRGRPKKAAAAAPAPAKKRGRPAKSR